MDISTLVAELPPGLQAYVSDCDLVPVDVGTTGSVVVQIVKEGATRHYLKVREHGSVAPSLHPEYERLSWLEGRVRVPKVVEFGSDEACEWLVTTALSGVNGVSAEVAGDAVGLVRRFGEALAIFHQSVSVEGCPFDASTQSLLDAARQRVEEHQVAVAEFQPVNSGTTPEELLKYLATSVPPLDQLVVAHGDYSMPNVIINEPELPGYVDVGLCGVGDPYLDLAIGAKSVALNLGGAAVGLFFEGYGIEWPELPRLDFFVNLQDLL